MRRHHDRLRCGHQHQPLREGPMIRRDRQIVQIALASLVAALALSRPGTETLAAPSASGGAPTGVATDRERWELWKTNRLKCGTNCVYMFLNIMGLRVRFSEVDALLPVGPRGLSLAQLREASRRLGLRMKVVRATRHDLDRIPLPVIMHLTQFPQASSKQQAGTGHFMILLSWDERGYRVIDGSFGTVYFFKPERLHEFWDGYLLVPNEAWTGLNDLVAPFLAGVGASLLCLRFLAHRGKIVWGNAGGPSCG
jgi:hypothetical protein